MDVFCNLVRKSELFPQFTEKYYYLFSKNGFTSELMDYAEKNETCFLISFQDMF